MLNTDSRIASSLSWSKRSQYMVLNTSSVKMIAEKASTRIILRVWLLGKKECAHTHTWKTETEKKRERKSDGLLFYSKNLRDKWDAIPTDFLAPWQNNESMCVELPSNTCIDSGWSHFVRRKIEAEMLLWSVIEPPLSLSLNKTLLPNNLRSDSVKQSQPQSLNAKLYKWYELFLWRFVCFYGFFLMSVCMRSFHRLSSAAWANVVVPHFSFLCTHFHLSSMPTLTDCWSVRVWMFVIARTKTFARTFPHMKWKWNEMKGDETEASSNKLTMNHTWHVVSFRQKTPKKTPPPIPPTKCTRANWEITARIEPKQ